MTNVEQSFRSLSPYGCAKVINPELEEMGLPTLPPQMFYQYVNKGYIPSFVAADGKRKVSELELAKWFEGYLEKKAARAQKKAEKISAALKPQTAPEPPCQEADDDEEPTAEQLAELEDDEMITVAQMVELDKAAASE